MPQVFSSGEPETRPLDPTAVVYTTAQKVANLLDIGPQEAVEVSADTLTTSGVTRVYVTGNDYRNIGFSAGDTVLVYSDADPLGVETTISNSESITGTTDGVGLPLATTLTDANFQKADNTYILNKASFTNGRTRGLTKKKVEDVILRMQDRIDNITHNAWRPYLVTAEYINFDTYKPYRRRYYTDYVGTTPLLFRNIQQILRLELWQGDDYREIGAAEIRIDIANYSGLSGDSIYLSPGNGSVATLSVGTGTNNWRADFDKVTTAQNLADLINKENRVSKAAIEFSPTFTLEGSTSNVSVDNEFLATANSDYGTGFVKITSMRDTVGGETCTIASTDSSSLSIEQGHLKTTKSVSVTGSTLTVDSTSGFIEKGLLMVGNEVLSYTGKTDTTFTGCTELSGTALTTANTADTEIKQHQFAIDLQGGSASGDKGRLRDWWLDPEMGIIYFNNSYPFFEWNAIKVCYIYGERYIEKAIEDICTKMVAIDLLMSDDRSVLIPEGTQNVDLASKIQLYRADIDTILPRYKEVIIFE